MPLRPGDDPLWPGLTTGRHAVIVGENKIGKSNLLFALQLILDPALPDSDRSLREEDF